MRIRAGFTLGYNCVQPTPMLLALNIRPERRADLLTAQSLTFDPPVPLREYIDGFDSAKREETREKRLREAISLLAAGKKLGLK